MILYWVAALPGVATLRGPATGDAGIGAGPAVALPGEDCSDGAAFPPTPEAGVEVVFAACEFALPERRRRRRREVAACNSEYSSGGSSSGGTSWATGGADSVPSIGDVVSA